MGPAAPVTLAVSAACTEPPSARGSSLTTTMWPWAVPVAMGIMITGNTLLAVSDYIPPDLHAKGTSFALAMTAYFITALAIFRSARTKSSR